MTVVAETLAIPASHLDLLTRAICGVMTTMLPDGQPQSSLVWVDHDGECARVNSTLQRQKVRNLLANPKLNLLIVDPDDTGRFIQIRGDAELVTDGALEHLDALTRTYTSHPRYYGFIYPLTQERRDTRVICRIHARRITLDAIHGSDESRTARGPGAHRPGAEGPGRKIPGHPGLVPVPQGS